MRAGRAGGAIYLFIRSSLCRREGQGREAGPWPAAGHPRSPEQGERVLAAQLACRVPGLSPPGGEPNPQTPSLLPKPQWELVQGRIR